MRFLEWIKQWWSTVKREFKKASSTIETKDTPQWIASVERVSDGFIIRLNGELGSDENKEEVSVCEDKEFEEFGDRHSFQKVVNTLIAFFDLDGSRYDKEKLYIELKPGEKHPDFKENPYDETIKEDS